MNIFVGNLEATVTSDDLRNVFAVYGTVIDALVIKDTATDAPLGYGHVYLVPDEAARDAIAGLDQALLKGRRITVRECVYRSRQERRVNRKESSAGRPGARTVTRRNRPASTRRNSPDSARRNHLCSAARS